MFANHYRLDNLTAIVDHNGLQMDGSNCDIMTIEPLPDKWRAFGWNVIECDGHDVDALTGAFEQACAHRPGPSAIIAKTVKGKGVSYMENVCDWHGIMPGWNEEQFRQGMRELGEEVN